MNKIILSVMALALFAVLTMPAAALEIEFIPPTPENNTEVNVNYVNVTVIVTDPNGVSTVLLNWEGTNETMNSTGENIYSIKKTGLLNGEYTYRVYANDIEDNWEVSETRIVIVNVTLKCGDVAPYPDGDGTVNMGDVVLLLNNVTYGEVYPICDEWAGDVNCMGGINMGDVTLLLNHVAYGSEEYPLNCC